MIKKILTIVLISIMVVSMCSTAFGTASNISNNEENIDYSIVLVVIKREYSKYDKEYSAQEFNSNLIENVKVINQISSN